MRNMIFPCFFAAFLALAAGPAAAQFIDGNELHDYCTTDPPIALGYMLGIADWVKINPAIYDAHGDPVKPKPAVCLPAGLKAGQIADVVCGYLERHPETRQDQAFFLTNRALQEAWPCPK